MTLLGDHKSHSSRGLSDEIKQVIDDYYKTKGYCIPESIFNHITIDHGQAWWKKKLIFWKDLLRKQQASKLVISVFALKT